MKTVLIFSTLLIISKLINAQTIIHVPEDHQTIQAGINAAVDRSVPNGRGVRRAPASATSTTRWNLPAGPARPPSSSRRAKPYLPRPAGPSRTTRQAAIPVG